MYERLVEAKRVMGEPLTHLPRRTNTDDVRDAFAYATEQSRGIGPIDNPQPGPLAPAAAPAHAYARLHAILRAPARFLREARPHRHDLSVRVTMTAEAYAQMYSSLRESPAWRFEQAIADDRFLPGGHRRPRDERDKQERYELGVMTSMRARFGDETVNVEFAAVLGRRPDLHESALDLAKEILGERYAAGLYAPERTGEAGLHARWVWRDANPRATAPPGFASTHHAFGPDHCEHPGAEWRIVNHPWHPYLSLCCPVCLRDRIAIRPAMPDRLDARQVATFVAHQRALGVLAGERLTDSDEAILERALAIPRDPAAYAIHLDLSAPAPARPAGGVKVRSIAEAMRRR